MRIERIVITGDVFRTTCGDPDQLWNARWLRDELAPVLCGITGLWPDLMYRRSKEDDGQAIIAEWFHLLGHTPSLEAWAATFGQAHPPPALVDELRPDYDRALVIGFELSPLMRAVLDRIGAPWIDVGVSPIRFLDDLALSLRLSWPVELAHPGLVSHDQVQEAVARMRTRYLHDASIADLDGACVFLAQTRHDRTLIKDGAFYCDSEIIERTAQALDGRTLVLKPHPLAPDNPILPALQQHFGARTTEANLYAILATATNVRFLTVASSAAIEARHFGHQAEIFHPAAHADLGSLTSLWAHRSASFWRSVLGQTLDLKPEAEFEERVTSHRLRRLLGSWGMVGIEGGRKLGVESSAVITVAICTFNRHHLLQEAIQAILRQTIVRDLFRILIVDNSSDKRAADAFYRTASFDPIVSVMRSDPPGLSRARNRAAAECGTQYVAYLDDDARPDPTWLSSLLAGFLHSPNVAAVGGPVAPIWSEGRPPYWLPRKHLGLLTIKEATEEDADLLQHQYLYGTNIALVVEHLLAMGGFPEQIGRNGASSLLSCEETQLQDALRAAEYVIRFVRSASVRHIVHEDRLRRSWMRSRMIWQSASEQLQTPPQFHQDWALKEIQRLADLDPDVAAAARLFFREVDGEALDVQLDAIRHFSALLMGAHRMPQPPLMAMLGSVALGRLPEGGYASVKGDDYAPSAAGASEAQYLFVEALPGHRYLYDLYGDIDGARLLTYASDDQAWGKDPACQARFKSFLGYVHRSIGRGTKAIFFLTFDGPTYGSSRDLFFHFLQACPVPVFGILHRMPDSSGWMEAVRRLDDLVDGICFLGGTMVDRARSELGLSRACYLPHHPTTFSLPKALRARDRIRARMGIRPEQVAFAVIGEARKGKGIPWLLSAFEQIPDSMRDRVFFIFAGKATEHTNEEVRRALSTSRLAGCTDLRGHPVASNYVVLSDREYAEYVAASDVGLLLYQDGQRQCMSGVLGDYLWANCKIIATANSCIGAEVRRHDLGLTLQCEDASTLAATLTQAVRLRSTGLSARAREYRASIAPQCVLEALQRLIRESGAGQQIRVQAHRSTIMGAGNEVTTDSTNFSGS